MMLTHCHKCGFHVRSERLTFNFAAWRKGFCAVAALSHAKNSRPSVTSVSVADENETGALLIQLPILPAARSTSENAGPKADVASAVLLMLVLTTCRAWRRGAPG